MKDLVCQTQSEIMASRDTKNKKALFFGMALFMMWRLWKNKNAKLELRRPKLPNTKADKVLRLFLDSKSFQTGYVDSPLTRWGGSYQGSISTILSNLARKSMNLRVPYERELLIMEDGGTIALDWAYGKPKKSSPPRTTVFLHHGLCGDSQSVYIKHLVPQLAREGYQTVVMIARGCGGLSLSTPEGFTAARTSDMKEALKVVSEEPFVGDIYGAGYSLGGILLLKHLGEEGDKALVKGAVAVSPSYDFSKTPRHFDVWSRYRLVHGLIEWAKKHEDILRTHPKIEWDKVINAVNVRAFDSAAVVGPFGYRDVDHYYEDSSPKYKTSTIVIPTLSVSAEDDPVCCVTSVPMHGHETLGPGLTACVTAAGGHVGFAEGLWPSDSWTDHVIIDWIHCCEQAQKNLNS